MVWQNTSVLRHAGSDGLHDLVLVHVVHGEEQVVHRADGVGGRIDRDLDRVLHVAPHEVADVAVERGREQHRLVRAGDLAQDPLDLRREAVVGHAVGLVEHDDLDLVEVELVLLQQVDQPQRRGDDHVDAAVEHVDLLMTRGAAVDGEHGAIAAGGDRGEHLGDLQRQLAGRHEHHRQRAAGVGFARQPGEHRHAERQRLAGAGLGPAADVAAGEGDRDRLGLDGERRGEPGGGETHVDLGRHAEVDEAVGM